MAIKIPPALKPLPDAELATILGVTRQAVVKARRRAEMLCVLCGKAAEPNSQYCRSHLAKSRKYQRSHSRKRNGHKAWKPGRPGRPPLSARKEEAA